MCVQQNCIQCACHYYGSFASFIKLVLYYVVSTLLIRYVKLRSDQFQFGLNIGGFKNPGGVGGLRPLYKICRILPQKIFYESFICLWATFPIFLVLKLVNIVSVFYLYIYLFIFFFILVCLFAKWTFSMCHPYLFSQPSENILD